MQYILGTIILLILSFSCNTYFEHKNITTKNGVNINYFSSCNSIFRANWKGDEYHLILLKDSSYIWYKSTGEHTISWGRYQENRKGWELASFISNSKEAPLIVEEHYDSTVIGTLICSHGWNHPSLLSSLQTNLIATMSIDNDTIQVGKPSRCLCCSREKIIDSVKVLPSKSEKKTITLHGAYGIKKAEYLIKDPKSNVFDCYFLRFHSGDFQVFDPKTACLQKKKLLLPIAVLKGYEHSTEMMQFKQIKQIKHDSYDLCHRYSSLPGFMLDLHNVFSGAGRSILLDSIKFD